MDRLKQFARERFERSTTCRALFDEIDADASGEIDSKEIQQLIRRMGFEEQLEKDPNFLSQILNEIDAGEASPQLRGFRKFAGSPRSPKNPKNIAAAGDGRINREEFLAWYLTKGCFYLRNNSSRACL